MHYHAAEFLEAIQQIDAISDHAQPIEHRPVEFSTLYRLFVSSPVEVTERTQAPDMLTPVNTQHDQLLVKVLEVLEPNGTLHLLHKHKFVDSPKAIQKALEKHHDLLVPIPVIMQAQKLLNPAA